MSNATRFEEELRLAAYRSITDRLIQQDLITKEEAAKIRKRIESMEEALLLPETDTDVHVRSVEPK